MNEGLLHGFFLRMILRRYSVPEAKMPRAGPAWADIAYRSESSGELLRTVCDAWDIPLGEIARRASLAETVIPQFIMGVRDMSWPEEKDMVRAIHEIVGKSDG